MFNSRLLSLIRKEFIQISRDPRTLVIALLIPVMQLLMLGYAATNDVRNLPMAVFDQDRSAAARDFLDAFRASDYFFITYDVDSENEIRKLIEGGDARVGLIIPPDYGTDLRAERRTEVMFVFDGSDATATKTALAAAQQIGNQHATDIQMDRLERDGLAGDHLRAITSPDIQAREIRTALKVLESNEIRIEQVEPTLEDVFLALANSD